MDTWNWWTSPIINLSSLELLCQAFTLLQPPAVTSFGALGFVFSKWKTCSGGSEVKTPLDPFRTHCFFTLRSFWVAFMVYSGSWSIWTLFQFCSIWQKQKVEQLNTIHHAASISSHITNTHQWPGSISSHVCLCHNITSAMIDRWCSVFGSWILPFLLHSIIPLQVHIGSRVWLQKWVFFFSLDVF